MVFDLVSAFLKLIGTGVSGTHRGDGRGAGVPLARGCCNERDGSE